MNVQIYRELEKVNDLLKKLLEAQKNTLEKIDDVTFGIIADDGFDEIPGDIQDAIYMLNNYEFEKPSHEELIKYTRIIDDLLRVNSEQGNKKLNTKSN